MANLKTGQLCKHGVRLKLHDQPFQVLAMLAAQAGELVTRQEIQRKLWPTGTFVDFENGLNSAVNRLRDVLGDSAEHPKFIETIPRRGYRFLPQVVFEPVSRNRHDAGGALSAPASGTGSAARITPHWNRILSIAAVTLSLVAVAPSLVKGPGGSVPSAGDLAGARLHPAPLVTYGAGDQMLPAFSPDGSRVAYAWSDAGGWFLEVKQLGSDKRLRLTRQGARFPPGPAWSPDGQQIAFVRADALEERGIFVTSAMGGPERKLRSLAAWRVPQRMVNWSPDGKWIAFSDEYNPENVVKTKPRGPNAIYVISPDTLETKQLTFPSEKDFGDAAPAFSPNGTMIAFVHTTAESHDEICTIPAGGGAPRKVVTEGLWTNGVSWTADSKSLVFDRSLAGGFSIWQAALEGGKMQRLDLTESRGSLLEPTLWKDRLAYEAHDSAQTIGRVLLDGSKLEFPQTPLASTRSDRAGRFSPKGDRIAFVTDRTGADEVWLAEADGSSPVQLTHIGTPLSDVAWAPDGKTIAVSVMAGKVQLISVETGASRPIFEGPAFTDEVSSNLAFSRNGEYVYVVKQPGTGEKYELLKVPTSGSTPTKIAEGIITNVAESPDGKTLFYSKAESLANRNPLGIWKQPVQGGEEQYWRTAPGLWDINESGLFQESASRTIERYNLAGKKLGTAAQLGPYGIRTPMSVAPDGRSVLFGYEPRHVTEIDSVRGIH